MNPSNWSAVRIVAIVIAALCFLAVLVSVTGDMNPLKVVAAGGLATLLAIVA